MTSDSHRRPQRRHAPSLALSLAAALGAVTLPATALAQTTTAEPPAEPAPYPREAIGNGAVIAGYAEARWAEDWSARRSDEPDDILDRLKFIPLSGNDEIWLSLSGELRARTAWTSSPGLRAGQDQRLDTLRLTAGADLHLGPHVRVFGELAHGTAGGDNYGSPVGAIRNDLAVSQAFVELNGEAGGLEIGARYGRQYFVDGSPYLISTRNGATILAPFNGTRAWVRGSRWRADVFDLEPTQFGTGGVDDDRSDGTRRFSGVNTSFIVPETWFGGSDLYFDPFYWRYESDARRWGATVAREDRRYAGARLWGEIGRFNVDWSLARQTGEYGARDIDAWHVFTVQNTQIGEGAGAPRVALRVDYASGGGAYDGGDMNNAVTPFGVPIFYAWQNVFNPVNMVAVAPSISIRRGSTTYTAEVQGTWRASERDAVYRATDLPYAGTQNVDGSRIGEVWRVQAVHAISPRVSLMGRYEHLAAGPVLEDAGYASSDYITAWINLRF